MSSKNDLLVLLKAESPRTASDLAKILDVTSRTIYRWVEKLAEEGNPVYSLPGRAGGVGLDLDGSVIASLEELKKKAAEEKPFVAESEVAAEDKNKAEEKDKEKEGKTEKELKLENEMDTNLSVHFLSEQSENKDDDRLFDNGPVYEDWLEVDFSDEEVEFKIDKKYVICKEAIFTRHVLNFTYHLPQGKMLICSTEPVKFFLHDGQWHILAWVRQVEKFKVFQLLNMTELQIGPEKHNRRADFSIQQAMKK